MKHPILIKILSNLVHLLSGLLATVIILYTQDWFGSGDTYSYLLLTLPLAISIAVFGKSILDFFPKKNKLLKILISLIVSVVISLTWVYAVSIILGSWINAFSIPVFLLWIIGIFFQLVFIDTFIQTQDKKTTIKDYIKVIIGFPITLFLSMIGIYRLSSVGSSLSIPRAKTFLIPTNFEGYFKVIDGEACGLNPTIENGRMILQIPSNGVLIVQPKFKTGITDHEYYFIDENGKRTKVEHYVGSDGRRNIPGVQLLSTVHCDGAMPDGADSTEPPLKIHYTSFIVHQNTTTRYNLEKENKEDKLKALLINLVHECRKQKNKNNTPQ